MKRTKTLSFKLSFLFISGMSFAMLAGSITTYIVQSRIVESFTNSRLKSSVYEFSKQTDSDLLKIETVVENTSSLVSHYFNETSHVSNKDYRDDNLKLIQTSSGMHDLTGVEYDDICCHYVFLNPNLVGISKEAEYADECGFFHVIDENGEYTHHHVTNVLKYDSSDIEHAGWWYSIVRDRKAEWLEPYYDENTNKNVFSFVYPIFEENDNSKELLGIVGIDVDLNLVIKSIDQIKDYKDAYAYLSTKNGNIVYHKDVETFVEGKYVGSEKTLETISGVENFKQSEDGAITYKYNNRRRSTMSIALTNDLIYGVSVRTSELRKPVRLITIIPQIVFFIVLLGALFLFYYMIKRHLKPLQDLHEAVDKVKEGDYKFNVEAKGNDEISDLTKSFSEMITSLGEKNRVITAMAYIDGLTGVKNSNAYKNIEKRLNDEIKQGKAKFAVAILDVDKLKMINDNLGHEAGDEAIIGSCYTLCKGFSHSPVFRIGGDEFVAVIEGEDYENRREIYGKLRNNQITVRKTKYDFSVGMATFEPGSDRSFKDVFVRADQEMYLSKKAKTRYEQD